MWVGRPLLALVLIAAASPAMAQNPPVAVQPEAATTPATPGTQPSPDPFGEPASQPAKPAGPTVQTIHDETIAGRPASLAGGRLTLQSQPPREFPLDEIAQISWDNAPELKAEWLGQDQHDLAKGGDETVGIQDLHLRLTGLATGKHIKQIHIASPGANWRLDPAVPAEPAANQANRAPRAGRRPAGQRGPRQAPLAARWKIEMRRLAGSDMAELFLEPPGDDAHNKQFTITVTYGDDSTAQASVKANTHTDASLKSAAGEAPLSPQHAVLHLARGDRLSGQLLELTSERLKLLTRWKAEVEVPAVAVRGAWLAGLATANEIEQFQEQLGSPGAQDVALVRSADGSLSPVAGRVEGLAEDRLQFEFEGQSRGINRGRLVGLVLARPAASEAPAGPYQVFECLTGDRISGTWTALSGNSAELATPWGRLSIPLPLLQQIGFRNGRLVYLSDLEPSSVEEVPYFGRRWHYRRDAGLEGGPLKIKGQVYPRGLAVHSRSVLNYAIGGQFQSFKATVGFDDAAGGKGRVVCRVLGDGRQLWSQSDLRGDQDPVQLDVSIAGVRQLTLEVDFGELEDTGDRVIWGGARMLR
jgi:hypothetical protein